MVRLFKFSPGVDGLRKTVWFELQSSSTSIFFMDGEAEKMAKVGWAGSGG